MTVTLFPGVVVEYGCFSGNTHFPAANLPALEWRYYSAEIQLKVRPSNHVFFSGYIGDVSGSRSQLEVDRVLHVRMDDDHFNDQFTGLPRDLYRRCEYDLSRLGSSLTPANGNSGSLEVPVPFPGRTSTQIQPPPPRLPFGQRTPPLKLRFDSEENRDKILHTISRINELLSSPHSPEEPDILTQRIIASHPQYEKTHRILTAPADKLGLILDMGADSRTIDGHDDILSTIDFIQSKDYTDYHGLEPDREKLVYHVQVVYKGEAAESSH